MKSAMKYALSRMTCGQFTLERIEIESTPEVPCDLHSRQ